MLLSIGVGIHGVQHSHYRVHDEIFHSFCDGYLQPDNHHGDHFTLEPAIVGTVIHPI
jgi:hypothetical protein